MEKLVVTLYAESQIHAGKGMDIGVVDLPIQRERTTGFPIIQGIKGSLKANIKLEDDEKIKIFGSESKDNNNESEEETKSESATLTTPGSIAFSEAKILLFPVRQPEKLFVWVTSPLALLRFLRALETPEMQELINEVENTEIGKEEALVIDDSEIREGEEIWLEDIKFKIKNCKWLRKVTKLISENVGAINYIKNKLKTDIVVVKDETFSDILVTMTEVVPRIRINKKTGTVETGALWYEEYLPQDTIMYFVVRKTVYAEENTLQKLKEKIDEQIITIGGKESVGKGLATLKVVDVK